MFSILRDVICEEVFCVANALQLVFCEGVSRNSSLANGVFSCSVSIHSIHNFNPKYKSPPSPS